MLRFARTTPCSLSENQRFSSGHWTGLKQKILAGFSQIFSFRKNSRGHFIPLEPFGLFKPDVKSNYDDLFLAHPRYERKACVLRTDSWKQSFQRKTSFTWPTRKPTNCFALCITKGKRFHFVTPKFFINIGSFLVLQTNSRLRRKITFYIHAYLNNLWNIINWKNNLLTFWRLSIFLKPQQKPT